MKYLTLKPAAVIVKHNNPCGVAYGSSISEAFYRANMADRVAAFGGCAVFNRPVDKETAGLLSDIYVEVVAAPDFEEGTIPILAKRKNLRIIKISRISDLEYFKENRFVDFKSLIDGGIMIQQSPINIIRTLSILNLQRLNTKGGSHHSKKPTEADYADMLFGWQVEQGVTSIQ
jgi:phosphoribosylaminoimidazolecarboxamide formyltransferase/IMP cyclohydrolase